MQSAQPHQTAASSIVEATVDYTLANKLLECEQS